MRFLVIALFLFATLLKADEFEHLSGAGRDPKIDKLTFTSTQRWENEFLKRARLRPKYLSSDWRQKTSLPSPPANSSLRTAAEIKFLKSLVSKRTSKMPEIKAEMLVTNFRFGSHT